MSNGKKKFCSRDLETLRFFSPTAINIYQWLTSLSLEFDSLNPLEFTIRFT